MKLCKDCKHLTNRLMLGGVEWAVCERPIPRKYTDYIHGYTHTYLQNAHPIAERTTLDGCGPEGKYWEPTLKYRIINLFKKNDNS